MNRTRTLFRAISGGVIVALAAAGLVAGAVAPASAVTTLVYDSIPVSSPGSYPSIGYQATSTNELADLVTLGGTDRALSSVTVGLTNWACESWATATPCATTPGSSFTHPITLNLYEVDNSGANPVVGDVILSVTEDKTIPFRPSADANCTGGKWFDGVTCNSGYAFNVTFDLSGAAPVVGSDVIVGIAYNTQHRGYAPIGQPGPYNSLNVSLAGAAPTVGTDVTQDEMYISSGASALGLDTGYSPDYHGLVLEIGADDSLIPAATEEVTVRQKDIKPSETSETYLQWHEGRNNATPAYSVQPDGLHLGTTASSNIVKGTDPATSEVSKAELRELIVGNASVDVVSGEGSFGVPLGFGTALTSGNYTFTTLHTDIAAGTNDFTLSDTWRTSKALFGDYTQLEEDTLENYLDYIYAGGKKVWLFGYNVQSNGPSTGAPLVVKSLTWDDTKYTFSQPTTEVCTPSGGYAVTNLDGAGWTFSESRSQSTTVLTEDGLSIETYGPAASFDLRKAAGYVNFPIDLADVGVPALNLGATSGTLPSIQLVTDFDGNGSADGILVGETIYGNDYWVPNSAAQFVKDAAPLHTGGSGSSNHGTLDQWLASFPDARVLQVGYSLGSGVTASAVIESIVAGCQTISFETATLDAPANEVTVRELDIRPNESTYAGWHEGYNNAARAYSVQDDGLHLGDGTRSQIVNGFDAPLLTTDLESFITGSEVVLVDGSVTLQVPVVYGPANTFTTLRSLNFPVGANGIAITDKWLSTRDIYATDGVTLLLPKNVAKPIADIAALIHSFGNVHVLGFGVQAEVPAVVESIRANDTLYTFEPYTAPVTSTVYVYEPEISPNEDTYAGWHEGYTNPAKSYAVTENGLTLGAPHHSQIIKGLDAPLTSPSVAELITGAAVEVEDGSVTFQVPINYGPGTDFLTLRSVDLEAGTHSFTLASKWASTRAVPSLGIVAHQPVVLGDLLDKLTNVRVLGFGVQANTAATVASVVFNQTDYRFDGLVAAPTESVTVFQKDVKASETSATYLQWHEGRNNATPAYSVQPDGLHLGTTASSNIVKGTDPATSQVTKAELRALIVGNASVDVVSGEGSFGVPLGFGTALTSGNYKFTTLHTDIEAGANDFVLGDTWRTSQALFGDYTQLEEDTLENFLNYIYAGGKKVWLFGYNVQSNGPSSGAPLVVKSLTWDDTKYTFFQPKTSACTPSGGYAVTNLDGEGWTFGESRSQSTTVFTDDGLSIATFGAAASFDLRKAAGYVTFEGDLADVGVPTLNLGATSGTLPSIQLVTDFDGNGSADGILVGETIYGNDYWVPGSAAQFVKDGAPLHTGGSGSANHGTLDQWLVSFPHARVVKVGYSLGSGVTASAVIESIVVGCKTISFEAATLDAPANEVSVSELDIRPNESTYAGWHEGYNNPARAFSVKDDGLHLGDGTHSQILNGFDTPVLTTDLESFLTSSEVVLADGSVTLQVPITYGPTNSFTTLRTQSLVVGANGVAVADRWITTRAILAADGATEVLAAGSVVPLADLAALVHSIGAVSVLGVGVQADSPAVVESIRANDTLYTFEPYTNPVTSTVYVYEPEIRPNEDTYPGWHEGYTNASKSYSVSEDGLTLGAPLHSQIIKGLDAPLTSPTVGALITAASVEVEDGSVTFQVPINYGPGTDFLTLRSVDLEAGTHSFTLASKWASTRAVPSLGIVAHQPVALGDLLDKLTNVRVLGFGVQANTAATVASIVFNQTDYRFDGAIDAGDPTVTGTAAVGQTLTASPGTWVPGGVTFGYQWTSDGQPISGATSSTNALTADELDTEVAVVVTASAAGYVDVAVTSPGVTVALGAFAPGTPVVSGTVQFGGLLSATPGSWTPDADSYAYQWLADGVPIDGAEGSFFTIKVANAGQAISVEVTATKAGYTTASATSAPTASLPEEPEPAVDRISGADRYEVAVNISSNFPENVDRVYLSNGNSFPDALSAAPAAAYLDVPLLLTQASVVPSIVLNELERLKPAEIVIVGGTVSVQPAVVTQLEALSFEPEVIRIGGANRYAVSRAIAVEAFPAGATEKAYVASGANFPDALAAAPAAAQFDAPVILVDGALGSAGSATKDVLNGLGVDNVTIAGGPSSVSAGIYEDLDQGFAVKRATGSDRYRSAVAINEDAFDQADRVYLTTGVKFPDALAGAALAGAQGAPLYLTSPSCIPGAVFASIVSMNPTYVTILGGTSTLSVAVEDLTVCS